MKGVDPMKVNKDGTVTLSELDLYALSALILQVNGDAYKEAIPVMTELLSDIDILLFKMGEHTVMGLEELYPLAAMCQMMDGVTS